MIGASDLRALGRYPQDGCHGNSKENQDDDTATEALWPAHVRSGALRRDWTLEILAGFAVAGRLRGARRQSATTHLVELSPRLQMLGPQRGLNSLEQSFQPSDQLGLGDSDFRLARSSFEGNRERAELVLQVLGQALLQLTHRPIVDRMQAFPTGFVHGGLADILEELPNHRRDPKQLRWLGDKLHGLPALSSA